MDRFFLYSFHIRRISFPLYIVAASESDEGLVYGYSPIITLCMIYTRYQTVVLSYDNIVYRTDKISDCKNNPCTDKSSLKIFNMTVQINHIHSRCTIVYKIVIISLMLIGEYSGIINTHIIFIDTIMSALFVIRQ